MAQYVNLVNICRLQCKLTPDSHAQSSLQTPIQFIATSIERWAKRKKTPKRRMFE